MDNRLERWVKNFSRGCLRKKAYTSLTVAEQVAARVKKETGIELHCYLCPHCLKYHLTKNSLTTWKRKIF